jgi:Cdc6-like AAA superfamily ATPase
MKDMTGKVRNIFPGGNTAVGFYSLYESVLQGLDRLFILKGGPGTGKSSLIRYVGNTFKEKGYSIELLHCSSDNDSLDGLIIPSLNIGIVDGTAPHTIDPTYPGVVEEIIHLGECWDAHELQQHRAEIISLTDKTNAAFKNSYKHFAKAKEIHLEREAVYLKGMNFEKANKETEKLLESIFTKTSDKENKEPSQRHMFFGAATPTGVVNFIDNLTEDTETRVILKGRPGSGKSTLLKKIIAQAQDASYDTEVYHCGFDPNSLDMVLIPELKVAVLDGTAPHEIEASRKGDEILDMYELCFDIDIDSEYASDLEEIVTRYKGQTKLGIESLAEAKRLHDKLEDIYVNAMDFDKVSERREYILEEILKRV